MDTPEASTDLGPPLGSSALAMRRGARISLNVQVHISADDGRAEITLRGQGGSIDLVIPNIRQVTTPSEPARLAMVKVAMMLLAYDNVRAHWIRSLPGQCTCYALAAAAAYSEGAESPDQIVDRAIASMPPEARRLTAIGAGDGS